MLLLGEAYAFGVVWSFVFMSASMVILRFKDKRPREYRMPLNVRLGGVEVPLGLVAVFALVGWCASSRVARASTGQGRFPCRGEVALGALCRRLLPTPFKVGFTELEGSPTARPSVQMSLRGMSLEGPRGAMGGLSACARFVPWNGLK